MRLEFMASTIDDRGQTEELGDKQIGLNYLHRVAKMVDGEVDQTLNQWYWGVKRQRQYLMIDAYLAHRNEWKEAIQGTLQKVQEWEAA
jgi:hypothetical protein